MKKINRFNWNAWTIFVVEIASLISAPVIFVLNSIFSDTGEMQKSPSAATRNSKVKIQKSKVLISKVFRIL